MIRSIFASMAPRWRNVMTLALQSERARTSSERELERLLAEGRRFSAEFPVYLANHLPMVLVAMQRLGGSDQRLGQYFATYREVNRLQPTPPPVARIQRSFWTA